MNATSHRRRSVRRRPRHDAPHRCGVVESGRQSGHLVRLHPSRRRHRRPLGDGGRGHLDRAGRSFGDDDLMVNALGGFLAGIIVAIVIGAINVGGEYGSGMISHNVRRVAPPSPCGRRQGLRRVGCHDGGRDRRRLRLTLRRPADPASQRLRRSGLPGSRPDECHGAAGDHRHRGADRPVRRARSRRGGDRQTHRRGDSDHHRC